MQSSAAVNMRRRFYPNINTRQGDAPYGDVEYKLT
jgi:hypothetical protein